MYVLSDKYTTSMLTPEVINMLANYVLLLIVAIAVVFIMYIIYSIIKGY